MKNLLTLLFLVVFVGVARGQWEVVHLESNYYYFAKDINFLNDQEGWVSGREGLLLKTIDSGDTWQEVENNFGNIDGLVPLSSDTIILLNSSTIVNDNALTGHIYKSVDGGNTWTNSFTYGEGFIQIQFTSPSHGYLTGLAGIGKSIDGGDTWGFIPIPLPSGYEWGYIDHLHMISDSVGYLFGAGFLPVEFTFKAYLLKTIDGGLSWQEISRPENMAEVYNVDFISEEIGVVAHGATSLTLDGGESWQELDNLANTIDIQIIDEDKIVSIHSPQIIIAGDEPEFAITYSNDFGQSWVGDWQFGGYLESVNFINDSVGFIAGQYGLIMKTEHCGGALPDDYPYCIFSSVSDTKIEEIKLYPNPARHKIYFSNKVETSFVYTILNASGQRLLTGTISSDEIDVSQLPNGNYFLLLENEDEAKIGRFTK